MDDPIDGPRPEIGARRRRCLGLAAATAMLALLPGLVEAPLATAARAHDDRGTSQSGPSARQEQPRIPAHLVHHDFKKATPTRWCARHRVVCVHELARRFDRFLAQHPHHRTHWGTAANRRKVHRRYIRAWRARYGGCSTSVCGKQRTRSLADDWSRFKGAVTRGNACNFAWLPTYRSPQFPDDPFYGFDCRPTTTSLGVHLGVRGKLWILCEAGTLAAGAGTSVMTGGVSTPVVVGVIGQSMDCTAQWSLLHFLNWP